MISKTRTQILEFLGNNYFSEYKEALWFMKSVKSDSEEKSF